MTYRARGRSIFELVIALAFTAFLIGFITVLCIGNYFRAKRAQERQRQRRLTKQVTQQAQYNNGSQPLPSSSFSSPRSAATAPHVPAASHDQESAFSAAETAGAYEAPKVPLSSAVRA